MLRLVSQQSPQGCPGNSTNICLVEHRSFSTLEGGMSASSFLHSSFLRVINAVMTLEGGMSASSFLHSSFLRVINAVMLWPVHVQKVPQASEHLCPAKLQTRCDTCCACQSICLFIPTYYGVPRIVDPHKSVAEDCAWLCASRGSPFQTPPFAGGSLSL